jgi:hypothetical protein
VPMQLDPSLYGISELLPPQRHPESICMYNMAEGSVGFDLNPLDVELVFKALQEGTIDEVHLHERST